MLKDKMLREQTRGYWFGAKNRTVKWETRFAKPDLHCVYYCNYLDQGCDNSGRVGPDGTILTHTYDLIQANKLGENIGGESVLTVQ